MNTFKQARAAVARELGETKPDGFEDAESWSVLLVEPSFDLATLVDKKDLRVHQEIYFDVEERLDRMAMVKDDDEE